MVFPAVTKSIHLEIRFEDNKRKLNYQILYS